MLRYCNKGLVEFKQRKAKTAMARSGNNYFSFHAETLSLHLIVLKCHFHQWWWCCYERMSFFSLSTFHKEYLPLPTVQLIPRQTDAPPVSLPSRLEAGFTWEETCNCTMLNWGFLHSVSGPLSTPQALSPKRSNTRWGTLSASPCPCCQVFTSLWCLISVRTGCGPSIHIV